MVTGVYILTYRAGRRQVIFSWDLDNIQTSDTTAPIGIIMRNIEIKAKIKDYANICKIAEELSGGTSTLIKQDDTFYSVNEGRLKMRIYADEAATLVRYDRKNEEGPKLSNYELLQFSAEDAGKAKLLDDMLKKCLGVRGRVVKER